MKNKDISRFRSNWQKEVDGAALYQILAEIEKQSELKDVYKRMAESEEKHILFWEKRLIDAGEKIHRRRPSWRTHVMGYLAKAMGVQFILPTLTSIEKATSGEYDTQSDEGIEDMSSDEKSHARLLAVANNRLDGLMGAEVAQIEGRHRAGGGNALRAAVLGANDGLVSILALTMGAAGANLPGHGVLITGIAGLLAGAGSMALGEWLSVQSSRELYEYQIKIEAEEIEHAPEDEQEELALIYQAKGLSKGRAHELAEAQMKADKAHILDTLSREELGIDPQELGGSPWVAAVTSFFLFSGGAIIPLLPYIFLNGMTATILSMGLGAIGLFLTGAAITLMTGRSAWVSGFRQVLVGLVAAGLVFGVGKLIGVSVGG